MKISNVSTADMHIIRSVERQIWKLLALIFIGVTVILSMVVTYQGIRYAEIAQNGRLILTSAVSHTVEIPANSNIDEAISMANCRKVVELLENWSYETIESHYNTLFSDYFTHQLELKTKNQLLITGLFQRVHDDQILSTFQIFEDKTFTEWSAKMGAAVSLVTGRRKIWTQNNKSFGNQIVSYILIAKPVIPYPKGDNPTALRYLRIEIEDNVEDPFKTFYSKYKRILETGNPNI